MEKSKTVIQPEIDSKVTTFGVFQPSNPPFFDYNRLLYNHTTIELIRPICYRTQQTSTL